MRPIFIPSDLHHARPFSKAKLASLLRMRCVPILLLGVCLPCPAQVAETFPASDHLSTSVKPEKPYEQSLESLSCNIPFQSSIRLGKVAPLVFPPETNSDYVQAESALNCDSPTALADCSARLNAQQQT